jgi:hypothetical protein
MRKDRSTAHEGLSAERGKSGVRRDQGTPPSTFSPVPLKFPQRLQVRTPGLRIALETVEQAISFIDKNVPSELARLSRWTFARALLLEARKTGKSRDLRTAVRQLGQALSNERWLDVE